MDLNKVAKASALVTLCLLPIIPLAVPYVFTAGSPIRSTEMNANFQALEALISSMGGVAPTDLVRVTANLTTVVGIASVLTVPSAATRPYVLRQTFTDRTSAGGVGVVPPAYAFCQLNATTGGTLPLMAGALTGLHVPFAPGDVITVTCGPSGSAANISWTFVFSK